MENEKYLPIVLIAKREKDILSTEGGGSSDLPKIVLDPTDPDNRVILESKSNDFIKSIETLPELITKKYSINNNTPTLLRVKINEKSEATSHRTHIRKLIDKDENKIIGMLGNDNILLRIDNESQYLELISRLKNINDYCYGLSCIDQIAINKPQVKDIELEGVNIKLKLANYNDIALNKNAETFFCDYFKRNGIEFKKCNYNSELIIYKLLSVNTTQLDNLIFNEEIANSIISIEPMPMLSITLDEVSSNNTMAIKHCYDSAQYPLIGVLDNGIAPNNYLKDWIVDKRTPYIESEIDSTHGTFVAGIINYGDELESEAFTGCVPCKFFDAQVMPHKSIDENELIDNIREIIKAHNEIKIWNMSLGTSCEADEYVFSDFGMALDEIQDKFNVLIVKSAGNCDYRNIQRISKSADSVRSLVVGSVAQNDAMALKNNPSPFSRVGRGPSYVIKPDVVHYGGNLDNDGKLLGVSSFDKDGNIIQNCGTSFSTPRVTSLAANLQQQIGGEFDPLLIKALIIHNSSYLDSTLEQADRIKTMGFGIPTSLNNMLKNDKDEITLIFRDNLQKGVFIDIFDLPIPMDLIENDNCVGQITATLVYNQILDAKQGNEYCQSNIDIKMGTYENLKERDVEANNILKNKYLPDAPFNVFLKNNYSKKIINENILSGKQYERMLIEYGSKYYPVKKYCINLDELTPSNKRKLCSGKKWYLQVSGLYRNQIVSEAKETGELLNQDFCLIITIKDPTKSFDIYDRTIRNIEVGNFWHAPLTLTNEVRVTNEIEKDD